MKKKLLALLLALSILLPASLAVNAADTEAKTAAETLHALGLFAGTGTDAAGNPILDLDRAPTRQEAVVMLVRLLGAEAEAKSGSWETPFGDVDPWAAPYVGYAYRHGLTQGTGAHTFGGQSPVSASQYIAFVLRAMGYRSGVDFQWDSAWEKSDALRFTDGRYHAGTEEFLRGDVAIISCNALSAKGKDGRTLRESLQAAAEAGVVRVHFLDVGQADCILIEANGAAMLIDGGGNATADEVTAYLDSRGVTALDYVIGTHPHEDHIGGLDAVIGGFPVNTVILPPKMHTTRTFEDLLDAIAAAGLTITTPTVGQVYPLGNAEFTIVAPNGDYGEALNNWSVGVRLVHGGNSFLFCGDAEAKAEADILQNGLTVRADVLKLSHHGSATSTTPAFLKAVSPTWAVISCGTGNVYGHPAAGTLQKLAEAGILLFRTDWQGALVAVSDGVSITWSDTPAANPGGGEG